MNILSISTSSNICSVAILKDELCIKELNIDDNNTHSEKLMVLVSEILNLTNLELSDINLIAVDIGPRFFYRDSYWNSFCKGNGFTFWYSYCWNKFFRRFSI